LFIRHSIPVGCYAGAGGAARDVRAQAGLFDLGQLTVECQRRQRVGTLALGCQDDSHIQ
jgi:hypothetical protein